MWGAVYNAHRSGDFITAYNAHSAFCPVCRFKHAREVLSGGIFCEEGGALARAWVDAFNKEAPEGSTYVLGMPLGAQPYQFKDEGV